MEPPRRLRAHHADQTAPPFQAGRWQRWRAKWDAFHLRDVWWRILDFFETHRGWRITLYCGGVFLILGVAARIWIYPWWAERNAIRIAQQWFEAGQYRNAAEAAERAARLAPTRPEPWQIAAELARIGNQRDKVVEYTRRAADLNPADMTLRIALAAAALNADKPQEARAALNEVPAADIAQSPEAQRIRGELARRDLRLTEALGYFEAATRLEGSKAINEIPRGLILLQSTDPDRRRQGVRFLEKWSADREWGATALRTLLTDAVNRNDRPAMRRWSEALRLHPGVTVGDMPNCLHALAVSDRAHYDEVLAQLEKAHAVTPTAANQLLGWLNQIGESAEAVRWMQTLPAAAMKVPPLAVSAAEAYRATANWTALAAWVNDVHWGGEAEFVRWTYEMEAARQLGHADRADELQRTLLSHAEINGVHGLFAGSLLYTWNRREEAVALWWKAAAQDGGLAIEALGSLARHFQVSRDAEGQYQVFRRLRTLQPANRDIGNNFAFFAALTGREQRVAERVSQEISEQAPDNLNYRATYAFVLLQEGHTKEALAQLQSRAQEMAAAPSTAYAYALALAANGQTETARQIMDRVPKNSLTEAEVALIPKYLGH